MIEKGIEHLSYPDMKRELQWRKVVAPTQKEKNRRAETRHQANAKI